VLSGEWQVGALNVSRETLLESAGWVAIFVFVTRRNV
jgi:hypothetical protein